MQCMIIVEVSVSMWYRWNCILMGHCHCGEQVNHFICIIIIKKCFSVVGLPFLFCISAIWNWKVCVWHWLRATWWMPTYTAGNLWSLQSGYFNWNDYTEYVSLIWYFLRTCWKNSFIPFWLILATEKKHTITEISLSKLQFSFVDLTQEQRRCCCHCFQKCWSYWCFFALLCSKYIFGMLI